MKVAGCWTQPNAHTGASAIVAMVGIMTVMVAVMVVTLDGTSSGVSPQARASLVPFCQIVYEKIASGTREK